MPYHPPRKLIIEKIKNIDELRQIYPQDDVLIYHEELFTLYKYMITNYPTDNLKIIDTILGGSNKWVGFAGIHSFYDKPYIMNSATRYTFGETIAVEGDTVYDTDLNKLFVFGQSGTWSEL